MTQQTLCLWGLICIFACSSDGPASAPLLVKTDKLSQVTDTNTADQAAARRNVIARKGALGEFKLETSPCAQRANFIEATQDVAKLVVGVAAGEMQSGRFVPKALGSGIIMTKTGFVLAHYHTVSEFEAIRVRLSSGKVLEAEWMGDDRLSDVVLLKINGQDYPEPRLSSADALSMGQWVVSVGSPFGLQQSISSGIVSARNRPYPSPGDRRLVRFVQSDVVIHPGSSGGPLIDSCGRIVAMNSAILGAGMSFSLRIDEALIIAEKLYSDGEFDRGFIGIVLKRPLDRRPTGPPIVKKVVKNGPAAKAGLKPNDIILRIDEEKPSSHHRLKWIVARTEPGEVLSLLVERNKKQLNIMIEVDSRP